MKKANSLIVMATLISCFPLLTQTSTKEAESGSQGHEKILVLASGVDSALILKMEDYIISRLQYLGYSAVSATRQYGNGAFKNIREEEPLKQLYPYDAVITISLLNKANKNCCMTGSDSKLFFWEYYADIYSRINTPGYYTAKGKLYWEANFYELNNWQLKYSVQTQGFEPVLIEKSVPEDGNSIINGMIRNNIVQNKNFKPF